MEEGRRRKCGDARVATTALLLLSLSRLISPGACSSSTRQRPLRTGGHVDNHAVIVSSSRYYHNYRHVANALSFYRALRDGGIPDRNIVLMLADDVPCNARNPLPNRVFAETAAGENIFASSVYYDEDDGTTTTTTTFELDYRGNDVSVDNFLRVLTGRHERGTPSNRKLHTGPDSNLLIFLTGHGGDGFFKFQDREELLARDLATAFSHMHDLGRYNEILFITDTCQAFTLADEITSPNVISIGSSLRDENSYAHHSDLAIGASVLDRFSHATRDFIVRNTGSLDRRSIADWIKWCTYGKLLSNVGVADGTSRRKIGEIPMSDFFVMRRGAPEMITVIESSPPLLALDGRRSVDDLSAHASIRNENHVCDAIVVEESVTSPASIVAHDRNCHMRYMSRGVESSIGDKLAPNITDVGISRMRPFRERTTRGTNATTPMSPSHPIIILLVVTFAGAIKISSRIW